MFANMLPDNNQPQTDRSKHPYRMMGVHSLKHPGVLAALAAALLFGGGTPFAKMLLGSVSPWLLAGLLYLGSGVGLSIYRFIRSAPPARLPSAEWPWLAGAVFFGGVAGPVLLMFGLGNMPASGASLLLNAEGVFTALIAWFIFRENFDRRIALGMAMIVAGAVVLTWPGEARFSGALPALLVLGACLAWGIDNNLTRKVSLADASWLAAIKGLAAGSVNLTIALVLGASIPPFPAIIGALVVGCLAYGVSLALFVIGLRHLGTARTGAYFSLAPFFGAAISILVLKESISMGFLIAGGLMAVGVWLHLTERHFHMHTHEPVEHEHLHVHDEHHQHEHAEQVASGVRHTHKHKHEPITHGHTHYPDAHHRHRH
jgi:drug/metabolite transporter (DMT)-like permease